MPIGGKTVYIIVGFVKTVGNAIIDLVRTGFFFDVFVFIIKVGWIYLDINDVGVFIGESAVVVTNSFWLVGEVIIVIVINICLFIRGGNLIFFILK